MSWPAEPHCGNPISTIFVVASGFVKLPKKFPRIRSAKCGVDLVRGRGIRTFSTQSGTTGRQPSGTTGRQPGGEGQLGGPRMEVALTPSKDPRNWGHEFRQTHDSQPGGCRDTRRLDAHKVREGRWDRLVAERIKLATWKFSQLSAKMKRLPPAAHRETRVQTTHLSLNVREV